LSQRVEGSLGRGKEMHLCGEPERSRKGDIDDTKIINDHFFCLKKITVIPL
jgi:hypothetical protein